METLPSTGSLRCVTSVFPSTNRVLTKHQPAHPRFPYGANHPLDPPHISESFLNLKIIARNEKMNVLKVRAQAHLATGGRADLVRHRRELRSCNNNNKNNRHAPGQCFAWNIWFLSNQSQSNSMVELARAHMSKMARNHIRVTTPSQSTNPLHTWNPCQKVSGYLAGLSYRDRLSPKETYNY